MTDQRARPQPLRLAACALATLVATVAVPAAADEPGAPAAAVWVGSDAGWEQVADAGPGWDSLSGSQRAILSPLEEDWPNITAYQKQQWIELATRYPSLSKAEQTRIRERMADWARMSSAERGMTRLNFQAAKQKPAEERQARWEAYRALTPEERRRLAERAASAAGTPPATERRATAAAAAGEARKPSLSPTSAAKSNIVPSGSATMPRPVSASTVQVVPGATTTLVTKRPTPPLHQQAGLPKIAATPTMVDPVTLLPRRGPQAAAVVPLPPRHAPVPKDD